MLVDLHCHLEGRVRPSTAAELAAAGGVPEPEGGWERAIRLDGPADLTVYLAKVASTYPFFRSIDATRRIAREAVEDAAAAGLDYLELRFGPATHAEDEAGIDAVIQAVVDGMREASDDTGMPSGAVVAALRHHDEVTNLAVARAAARWAGAGVVGFDLAGDELLFPALAPHRRAFDLARAAGLGITCHAAEAAPGAAAREAVEVLGATRIGHGAHILADADVLRFIAGEAIVVEICPTSNWYTGAIADIAQHPAPAFRDAGVRLALGDDNPMQTGSDLSGERAVLRDQLGFSPSDLHALDRTSVDAAFLDPSTRTALSAKLDSSSAA
ncbi:adenosine deaminase [Salinibacterium sp. G-O1]|uniref:adenosine deaminase n=1 Tax=Salinibacterium sp. G-O1 TaxID=3046208 RepID=UPI0024B90FD9|nr:adenosine deaminase [Salinibacterium sp. G-O1]MDJ0334088.1 adenosine deaminase [Salinibacterium sp. G-O1]